MVITHHRSHGNKIKREMGLIPESTATRTEERIVAAKNLSARIDSIVAKGDANEKDILSLREAATSLSESTVCEKGELDWSEDSIYASIPRIVGALVRRK